VDATVAGGAIAVAADEAAMGLDRDLQDGGIFGTTDRGEGAAAVSAATGVAGNLVIFGDSGEVRIVAAAWPLVAALLAAWPPGWGVGARRRRGGSGASLGLFAKELLLAQSQLGAELFVLLEEQGFAFDGALVQGFPVASLSPGLELDGQARANGTRAVRERRGGAGGRWGRGRQEKPRRIRAARTNQRSGHANRCRPDLSAGQRS